ncbi:MAG: hypothetical protein Q4G70_04395 [Pseudomonadota bacterium]|nr:hypothetical protein [Pseudomonadota bacterium]
MPALAPVIFAAAMTGCATSTGPVAGFDGTWTISKRGLVASQPQSLTRAAEQEATAHCGARGQRFQQTDLKESPPGSLAPQAESMLTFRCE